MRQSFFAIAIAAATSGAGAQPASRDPMRMPIPPACQPDLATLLNPDFLNNLAGCMASHLPAGPKLPEKALDIVPTMENAQRVAKVIFGMYNTGYPIAITRVRLKLSGESGSGTTMCLLLLSGTEPTAFTQTTTLPEDVRAALDNAPDDELHQAIMRALADAERRGFCDTHARLMIAGHSLGGMEAQNVAEDLARHGGGMQVTNIVTYGSPLTAELPGSISIRRFSTIGDPIPYTTVFTNTFRPATQTIVDDQQGQARLQAIRAADIERGIALGQVKLALASPDQAVGPGSLVLGHWLLGAVTVHMDYPKTGELKSYDVFGNRIGYGITGQFVVDSKLGGQPVAHMYSASRHSTP